MANPFFAALMNGNIRMPDASINHMGPLPSIPSGSPQFNSADGQYNQHGLPVSGLSPYAYGQSARISTQTQMAHPNRVQLIIPKLYLPSPQADIANVGEPVLEHSISDGDLVFSFRMTPDMTCYGSQYFNAPYGYSAKAVPLINLATANYILWGLQVGMRTARNTHWATFFGKLLHNHPLLYNTERLTMDHIWNFIKTFIRPFAIQHGGDMQGGRHEGDTDPIVTHGAVDYVSSFAIEGKLLHVNNLWRDFDVHEGDDLILSLEKMESPHSDIFFDLSSSSRTHRTERAPVTNTWYYLRPSVLEFKSFVDKPHVHIGRSQKYCSLYSRGQDICCWNARMCVVPGAPLQLTFEPGFVQSDDMFYEEMEIYEDTVARDAADDKLLNKDWFEMNAMFKPPVDPMQSFRPYAAPPDPSKPPPAHHLITALKMSDRAPPRKRPVGALGADVEPPAEFEEAAVDDTPSDTELMPPPASKPPATTKPKKPKPTTAPKEVSFDLTP